MRAESVFAFVVAGWFLASGGLRAQTKTPVTLDSLLALKSPASLSLSPNGGFLTYVEKGEIYVCAAKPNCSPIRVGDGSQPQWSPSGNAIAFLRKEADKWTILEWELKAASFKTLGSLNSGAQPMTPVHWNLEDNSLNLVSVESEAVPLAARNLLQGPALVFPDPATDSALTGLTKDAPEAAGRGGHRTALYLFDSRTGKNTLLVKSAPNFATLDWSPDGAKLVGAIRDVRPPGRYVAPSSTIFLLDVRTGSFRRLRSVATNPWSSAEPKWSPDGAKIAFVASTRPYAVDAVFVQAVGSGEPVELHTRPAGSVMGFTWDGDSKSIFMQLANGAKRPIVRLSLTAGHSETVSDTGVHSLQFSASKRGDLAWIESTGSTYGVIRYLLAGTKASTVLANLNPQMLTWDLGEQQIVRWSNKGGDALEGILVRPVGYRAGHRYPLIVDPYGNRVNDFQGIPILANQTLAAKGYALFFPNHRGPQTFAPQNLGKAACAKACWTSDPGVLEVEDILSGVDALIHQGVADPDRLYLYGVSNGASAVNLILTRTGRFRAAVSFGGVADWFNYYMYRTPDDWTIPDFLAGKTPERDLALYLSISPLYHVPGVTTPLLLLTGDNDSRAIQAVLFYDGLRRLGKPVTLVRYSGEGHGISDANLKDYWNRVEEFLSQDRKP